MTQLLLDLEPPPAATFENFVVGGNAEALAAVRALGSHSAAAGHFVYLWGDAGCGRSHLLRAACKSVDGRYLDEADAGTLREAADSGSSLIAVDDVEKLDAAAQEALFHAINLRRATPDAAMIVAGNAAPRDLVLDSARDDLRSRLAWGLVYRLEPLDDIEKDAALARHADERGFPLIPDVRRYLLTHCSRDLGTLMQIVDALDRHAREHQRLLTLPLIREFLQRDDAQASSVSPVTA